MSDTSQLGDASERKVMLIDALRTAGDQRCIVFRDQLHDYVAAQLVYLPDLVPFRELAAHLDGCEECSGAFARLYELEHALLFASLPDPVRLPSFDMTFLLAFVPTLVEQLRAVTRRFGASVSFQLNASLRALLPASLASSTLRSTSQQALAPIMALQADAAQQAELPLSFTVYREPHDPARCRVEVELQLPNLSWPDLADIPITISYDGGTQHALTDAWGLAAFPTVPLHALDTLRIDVLLPE
jgi:hypothetical protein